MKSDATVAAGVPLPGIDEIYRDFSSPVSRLCRRMIRDVSTAEDAAQECWCEIVKALPSFRGESKLSTWIWTIARRCVFRFLKKEKTYSTRFLREYFELHQHDGLEALENIPVDDRTAWVKLQCSECLTAILHCVPNEARFLYLLRRIGDLPYNEIAAAVGVSEESVRQSYSRSTRKINHFMSGQCMLYNPKGSCRCKMREPIKNIDIAGEYKKIRDLSRKVQFLEAADSWYDNVPDFWKEAVKV